MNWAISIAWATRDRSALPQRILGTAAGEVWVPAGSAVIDAGSDPETNALPTLKRRGDPMAEDRHEEEADVRVLVERPA
ncbi:hypothetical protein ACVDG5_021400 [Mesorhizobium sp. ORM6]